MKSCKSALIMAVFVLTAMCIYTASLSAAGNYQGGGHSGGYYGGGGYHGGHYWGGHGRSNVNFGVAIGGPYWGGSWYYPYYYPYYNPYYYPYAPAATVPSMPQEYIERSDESLSTPSGVWYYCPESKAYYPYVTECPGGWQTVPAQPPSESGR